MMVNKEEDSVKLVYTDGWNSNKEYNVYLKQNSEGWVVECIYGKRYNARSFALKTPKPVSFFEAREIFDKTIYEKERKGYVKY